VLPGKACQQVNPLLAKRRQTEGFPLNYIVEVLVLLDSRVTHSTCVESTIKMS